MKKIIASILVVAAFATTFIGCTKKGNTTASTSADGIKLEMYYYKQENQEGLKNIVKAFEKANPGVISLSAETIIKSSAILSNFSLTLPFFFFQLSLERLFN